MRPDPSSELGSCYSPAEAALYGAEQARPGAAIEFPLAPQEHLAVRLLPATGPLVRCRGGELHATIDDDAVILSGPPGYRLGVQLDRYGDSRAPLKLRLPGVALIVMGADLHTSKPDAKSVTIQPGAPIP